MNESHRYGKMRNRIKRLKKHAADAGSDIQRLLLARAKELEEILHKNKMG